MKLIKEITFASIVSVLLMMPFGSVFSENLLDPEPKNNTIPLWGPTWCKDTITYRIDNTSKLSDTIQDAMKQGVTEWADHAPTNSLGVQLQLVEFDADTDTTPDIILKFKKGGGRVQGQALQQNDGAGCFTQVKINVSGKAFGNDSSFEQVKSIAMQEVGHGLGLLHSDNPKDVMYGTVQSTPNDRLSLCDIEAWEAVMHWLVSESDLPNTDPHAPDVDSVTCNVPDPGDDPGDDPGAGTPTFIDITNGPDHKSQTKDGPDGDYQNRDLVHIFVNTDVLGASVHVVIDAPKSRLSGDTTTDENGVADIHYKVNAGRNGTGEYHIFASSGTLSCEHERNDTDVNNCLAHFTVS